MALADALATVLASKPGPKCTVSRLLAKLDPAERADYEAALANDELSAVTICKAFALEGHSVSRSPVERHRRGGCACGSR
tara:strand:+ start:474 stop:713 length:240 start_codon:yes stop_codon:yes gene_type:complete